ncbi:MAG: hypothetical protein ACI4XG_11280, partial [Bradyrhizobium sp.]
MSLKLPAANKLVVLLAAAAVTATAFGMTAASAQSQTPSKRKQQEQYDRDGRRYYGAQGPNRVYQQGPRTRVYVTTR